MYEPVMGRRLRTTPRVVPVTGESDVHHYRIAFDHHRTYDILCTDMEITYRKVSQDRSMATDIEPAESWWAST